MCTFYSFYVCIIAAHIRYNHIFDLARILLVEELLDKLSLVGRSHSGADAKSGFERLIDNMRADVTYTFDVVISGCEATSSESKLPVPPVTRMREPLGMADMSNV